ncbi:hypothetical protein Ancab_004864 [Ancistrocladus abbreviatus]
MRRVVPEFNRGVEKREDGLHGKITSSDSRVKLKLDAEVEFGKVDDLSFVLSAGRTKWQPNSRKEKAISETSVDKLPPNDENPGSISSRDQEGDNINIRVESEEPAGDQQLLEYVLVKNPSYDQLWEWKSWAISEGTRYKRYPWMHEPWQRTQQQLLLIDTDLAKTK